MSAQFEVVAVDYKSGLMATPAVERLPLVHEIGAYLDRRLRELMYDPQTGYNRYVDVTLVGHSMGGLAIKAMLTSMLEAGRGQEFAFIRQAIFFATPHFGSMLMEGFRRFIGKVIPNKQDEMLRGFNDEVAALHEKTEKRIVRAARRDTHGYPLPMTSFWGMADNIVPQMSAQGMFGAAFPLPGNHLDVHCPTDSVPGSLLSIESMQRTLGGQYTGPFHLVRLHGWQRGWDVQMPNTRWRYRDGQRIVTPEHVVYLNVRRAADRHINAALFVVTRDALGMFDQREWIYDRVDVSGAIENVTIVGGTAWMYVARPEHMSSAPPPPPESIIRRSYLDILASALITLGDDFRREYEATTDAVRPELVVDDIDD